MRIVVRLCLLLFVACVAASPMAHAQQQTGEIFGKVTDQSGAVMPGVTVTVTGTVLLRPLTAVSSDRGTYQFPRLEVGSHTVRFELTGFKTVVDDDVRVTVGSSAQTNAVLSVSTVQETGTVSGQIPVVDTKETGTSIQSPSRVNGGGIATVPLDGVGENRLPNYQNLDVHVERPIVFGAARLVPTLDAFNLTNGNIVQALQRTQNAATANQISAVVAPRVVRLGIKVTW